jgi:hypothetical protein
LQEEEFQRVDGESNIGPKLVVNSTDIAGSRAHLAKMIVSEHKRPVEVMEHFLDFVSAGAAAKCSEEKQ